MMRWKSKRDIYSFSVRIMVQCYVASRQRRSRIMPSNTDGGDLPTSASCDVTSWRKDSWFDLVEKNVGQSYSDLLQLYSFLPTNWTLLCCSRFWPNKKPEQYCRLSPMLNFRVPVSSQTRKVRNSSPIPSLNLKDSIFWVQDSHFTDEACGN